MSDNNEKNELTNVEKMTALREEREKKLGPIEAMVKVMSNDIVKALPDSIGKDRFMLFAMQSFSKNPKLKECTPVSIASAFLECAKDGLMPDGKEAAIIPQWEKKQGQVARYNPMVHGIVRKINEIPGVLDVSTDVYCSGDHFVNVTTADGLKFEFSPNLEGERGGRIAVFALVRMENGGKYLSVVKAEEVLEVKKMATSKMKFPQYSPWNGAFEDEMWKKTALHRVWKIMKRKDAEIADRVVRHVEGQVSLKSHEPPEKKLKSEAISGLIEGGENDTK